MFAYPDFEKPLNIETVKLLLDNAQERSVNRMMLITWGDINTDAKALAETSKIEIMDTEKMLQEINERNLDIAIDEFRMDVQGDLETKFSKERFKIYLDLVKNASSNMAKKDSLEVLSKYFLNGIKGLKVIDKNYRGPSEEFDLIVANESDESPLKAIGNPVAVECRHRRRPASSKDIRDFFGKLNAACLKAGILISLKGITGNQFDAVGAIRDARKGGICIIVIDIEDLKKIAEGKTPIEIVRECFYKYI